jgi:hypothetical protein
MPGPAAIVGHVRHEDAHIGTDPEVVPPIDQRDAKHATRLRQFDLHP